MAEPILNAVESLRLSLVSVNKVVVMSMHGFCDSVYNSGVYIILVKSISKFLNDVMMFIIIMLLYCESILCFYILVEVNTAF